MALHILRGRLLKAEVPIPEHDISTLFVLCVEIEGGAVLPLAPYLRLLKEQIQLQRSDQVTVAWHVTDRPVPREELDENVARQALGDLRVNYHHAFSSMSGYVWTDEKAEVGGHDIVKELTTAIEGPDDDELVRYLHLEIETHDVAEAERLVPILLLGVPLGTAESVVRSDEGDDETYENVALNEIGDRALVVKMGVPTSGLNLTLSRSSGRWLLRDRKGGKMANGSVSLMELGKAFEAFLS